MVYILGSSHLGATVAYTLLKDFDIYDHISSVELRSSDCIAAPFAWRQALL